MELPEAEGNHKERRKYTGIRLRPSGRWGSRIFVQRKYVCLGTYDTEEAAAMAHDAAALEFGLPRGHLNFPEHAENPFTEGNKTTRKYRGIYQLPSGNWYARICNNHKTVYLGGKFKTAEDAARAYDEASLKFHGYKAVVNFPDRKADLCPHLVDLVSGEEFYKSSMPFMLSHEDGQDHESSLASFSIMEGNHKERRKYKGVTLRSSGRWLSQIAVKRKIFCLGTYDTEEAAAMAYDAAALEFGLPRGHLNFPERAKNPSSEGNKTTRKYRGVYQLASGDWNAKICDPNNHETVYLGKFKTAEDAARAYDEASLKFHGYRAVVNFPDRKADLCPHLVDLVSGEEFSKSSLGSMPILLSHEYHESSLPSSSIMELPETEGNHQKRRKYKGTRHCPSGRWGALIRDKQKRKDVSLGTYDTEEAAAMAYDAAALELGLPRGYLNFPERAKNPSTEGNKTTRPKYRGVYLTRSGKCWYAKILDPNKRARVHLGMFSTAEEAAKAYDEAALKFRGFRAVLNFPDSEADPCPQSVDLVSAEEFSKSLPGSVPTLLSHEDGQNHESSLASSSSTTPPSPKRLKTYAGKSPCSAPGTPADVDKSSSGSPSGVNYQQPPVNPSKLQCAGNAASSDICPWNTVVDASLTSEDVICVLPPHQPEPQLPDCELAGALEHVTSAFTQLPGLHLEPRNSEESLFAAMEEISELHALLDFSIPLKDEEIISAELEASVAQLEEDSSWIFSVL